MWLKDSVVIKPSKKVVIGEQKGELKLFMVSIEDAAKYTCVYKNKYGEQKESAVLIVDGVDPRQSSIAPGEYGVLNGLSKCEEFFFEMFVFGQPL